MSQISPTAKYNGRCTVLEAQLADGDTTVIKLPAPGGYASLTVSPDAGASATVKMTNSSSDRLAAGTAKWTTANIGTKGVVTPNTAGEGDSAEILVPITAFKVTASGGAVLVELQQ